MASVHGTDNACVDADFGNVAVHVVPNLVGALVVEDCLSVECTQGACVIDAHILPIQILLVAI